METVVLAVALLIRIPGTPITFLFHNNVKLPWTLNQLLKQLWTYCSNTFLLKKINVVASLVVQWLRLRLPMQGTWVQALVREDSTCRRATKPVHHNYWACVLEPASHNYWSPRARACALQREKSLQWEACAPQRRVAPARRNQRKARMQQRRPNVAPPPK